MPTGQTNRLSEPPLKRVHVFFDGQNLYQAAKRAFRRDRPDYCVQKLAQHVCAADDWRLDKVHFYTGYPSVSEQEYWHRYWSKRTLQMKRRGVRVFTKELRYRTETVKFSGGGTYEHVVGREKGIDVRLALDIVHHCRADNYDVAVIFSQDQDIAEAVREVISIAREQRRWVKVCCAFPSHPGGNNNRGLNGADWLPIDQSSYEQCLDATDFGSPRRDGN